MSSGNQESPLTGLVSMALNIDIWEHILDGLVLMGYEKTLVSCALTCRELTHPTLRRLYSQQFSYSKLWDTPSEVGLWKTVLRSMISHARECSTTESVLPIPYFAYLRHLDTHNLVFASEHLRPELQQLGVAVSQMWPGHPESSRPVPFNLVPFVPGRSLFPAIFIQSLVRLSKTQDLRTAMTLTNITAEKWEALLPDLFSCRQLQTLSLDNPEGLDRAAANIIMEKLPGLKHLTVIRPELEDAQEMVSFISALKPDQLHSFSYSFHEFQVPVLQAIAGLTGLQELSLTFNDYPPVDLHVLAPLTNLTSLRLIKNGRIYIEEIAQFEEWACEKRETVATWLISCQNLASLYIFSMPALVPAIADALPHLRLEKLHIYDTECSMDICRALRSQRLKYLFLHEHRWTEQWHYCLADPCEPIYRARKERAQAVMDAVLAMPCLRDLRLHTRFDLTTEHLREMARCVPRLETLSCQVGCEKGEQTEPLEILEEFKHLTSLTCLGWTTFSARYILEWIQRTRCHLRPGGFSLCLPSQSRGAWYRHLSPGQPLSHCRYTGQIKELLKCFKLFVTIRRENEQTWDWGWVTRTFHEHEERMFFKLWRDVRGPADGLKMISGEYTIYPPYYTARYPIRIEVS